MTCDISGLIHGWDGRWTVGTHPFTAYFETHVSNDYDDYDNKGTNHADQSYGRRLCTSWNF